MGYMGPKSHSVLKEPTVGSIREETRLRDVKLAPQLPPPDFPDSKGA